MAKIQDLPLSEKPREKAERFGIESLNDEELLALVIASGTIGHSSLDIAKDILNDSYNLSGLINKPLLYFYSFKGLKKANALKILAVAEIAKRVKEKQYYIKEENQTVTSDSLYHRYALRLAALPQEQFVIVILNKNKQVISERTLYRGNENEIIVNNRDIMRLLMIHNGYYFYIIHNHPNGSFLPSLADRRLTRRLSQMAKNLNVKMLDHIIISQNGYYSFLHAHIFKQTD